MMRCGIFILNKSQLQLNEVCYKVSLTENFQQQSCSTMSFPYVTVHRLQRETQPFNLKFSLEVTHPIKTADSTHFRQQCLTRIR